MQRLTDKVCAVTGGAHGIGRATCKRLAQEGARVAVLDITDEDGRAVRDELVSDGAEAEYWHLDVTDETAVQETLQAVAERFGRLDVLVNNAGISGANKPPHEITSEEWDEVMAVNVRGVFYCNKAAIPLLRKAGGRKHREPVLDLRHRGRARHSALPRLQGRGARDEQDRRALLRP